MRRKLGNMIAVGLQPVRWIERLVGEPVMPGDEITINSNLDLQGDSVEVQSGSNLSVDGNVSWLHTPEGHRWSAEGIVAGDEVSLGKRLRVRYENPAYRKGITVPPPGLTWRELLPGEHVTGRCQVTSNPNVSVQAAHLGLWDGREEGLRDGWHYLLNVGEMRECDRHLVTHSDLFSGLRVREEVR